MGKHLIILILVGAGFLFAQDSSKSLAFKKNRPGTKPPVFYQPDLSYRIWQQFNLIKEANSGNALAQHELGLRYLLGEDEAADTSKAVFWIRKAALQKLPAAAFNYGILLYNGWGVEWNPYEAFKNFKLAADDGMAQAQFIVGVLNTDNLIVKRDWGKAYYYIKQSADKGYKQAVDIIKHIREQLTPGADTTGKGTSRNTIDQKKSEGLVFIDFNRPIADPTQEISDSLLIEDLLLAGNKNFDQIITSKDEKSVISFDKSDLPVLEQAASWGCPEAITLIGRLYEKGIYYKQDLISAASYYVRGAKMDSYRSTLLLYSLIKNQNFISALKDAAMKDNPEAMFVWYGLFDYNLDNSITEKDAVNMLVKSGDSKYVPAMTELGLLIYTGKYFRKDIAEAINIWQKAALLGSKEAGTRISASVISGETEGIKDSAEVFIREANDNGSVFAQVMLANLYAQKKDKNYTAEDIRLYRSAAQRGNRYAFEQLKKKYDYIRPPDAEFKTD